MVKKETTFVILALLAIVVSGCNGDSGDGGISGSFVGGSDGLDISFIDEEPPERVLDANSEQFFITVAMENAGEHTIEPGKVFVTLSGIGKDQFQIDTLTKKNVNQLIGVSKDRDTPIEGGLDEVSFIAKYKEDLNQDFSPTIRANVCYSYGTKSLSNICLRRDVVRRAQEGECLLDEEKDIENSGAPIHVTSLKERRAGSNEVKLIFTIENMGSGTAFSRTAFSNGECGEDKSKEDFINVEVRPVSNVDVRCDKFAQTSSGVVRLNSEGKTTVTCEVTTHSLQETPFEEPLNVNLDYIYKETIARKITIENAI